MSQLINVNKSSQNSKSLPIKNQVSTQAQKQLLPLNESDFLKTPDFTPKKKMIKFKAVDSKVQQDYFTKTEAKPLPPMKHCDSESIPLSIIIESKVSMTRGNSHSNVQDYPSLKLGSINHQEQVSKLKAENGGHAKTTIPSNAIEEANEEIISPEFMKSIEVDQTKVELPKELET